MIFGIILTLAEAIIPSFFIIWFGFAAILVGGLLLIAPFPLVVQLVIWLGLSLVFFTLSRRYFSPKRGIVPVGTSSGDVVGQIGVLISEVSPLSRGRVRFPKPILGSDEWPCSADEAIPAGARVSVVAVEGQLVKVQQITDQ